MFTKRSAIELETLPIVLPSLGPLRHILNYKIINIKPCNTCYIVSQKYDAVLS